MVRLKKIFSEKENINCGQGNIKIELSENTYMLYALKQADHWLNIHKFNI